MKPQLRRTVGARIARSYLEYFMGADGGMQRRGKMLCVPIFHSSVSYFCPLGDPLHLGKARLGSKTPTARDVGSQVNLSMRKMPGPDASIYLVSVFFFI